MPDLETRGACDLAGQGVLITRPAAQADGLCQLVEAAGGRAVRFPAVSIQPIRDPEPAQKLLMQSWDLILFISSNAVEQAMPLFPERRLPGEPRLVAIGAATAKALTIAGRAPDLVPSDRFDSESLLALPELEDLTGRRVLIVRGAGGRALLGDTLVARGAELAYAEVYRRALPLVDSTSLVARWRQDIQMVTATSGEVLNNLLTLVGRTGRDLLLATPLVVVSERTAKTAEYLGFAHVELAKHPSDAAVVASLCRIIVRFRDP